MVIEITAEQYRLIGEEVIILEDELARIPRSGHVWKVIGMESKIRDLKEILESEEIEI